jgi:hypothetical protein
MWQPNHPTKRARRPRLIVTFAAAVAAPMFAGCSAGNGADDFAVNTTALRVAGDSKATAATGFGSTSSRTAVATGATTNLAVTIFDPTSPPPPPLYVSDAHDTATVLSDADRFWTTYFGDGDETSIEASLSAQFDGTGSPYWGFGQETSALVQMYDLLAPIDAAGARKYLARLHSYAAAFLANRDDVRNFPADPFRNRVMPAWGAVTADRDCHWNTDVSTSGLYAFAMAAFSRRVLENPSLLADDPPLQAQYQRDAIHYVSAVLDTYQAFRPEMHLDQGDSEAYFTVPAAYATLTCNPDPACVGYKPETPHMCTGYQKTAGAPLAYNENLSMMKALAETALASNTALYMASPDADWGACLLQSVRAAPPHCEGLHLLRPSPRVEGPIGRNAVLRLEPSAADIEPSGHRPRRLRARLPRRASRGQVHPRRAAHQPRTRRAGGPEHAAVRALRQHLPEKDLALRLPKPGAHRCRAEPARHEGRRRR